MITRRTASRSVTLAAALIATAALAVSSPVASAATDTAAGGGWTLVIPFVGSVTFFGPGGVIGFTGITQMGGG